MARIYSQASRVLVWLGEPSNAIRTAVSWANRYRSRRPFLHHMKLKTLSWLSTTAKEVYTTELRRAAWGNIEVFGHLYWTRMWTFQEYRLARTSPLLVWRSLKISGNTLRRGGTSTLAMVDCGLPNIAQLYDGTTNFLTGEPCGEDSTISFSSMEKPIIRAYKLLQDPLRLRLNDDLPSLLLETYVTRTCSDPRDYVYALYGLLPDLRRACPVDYSKSEQEVMHDTAIYLARSGDLTGAYGSYTLYDNRLCSGSASSTLAPSWVPDLTRPYINLSSPGRLDPSHSPHQFCCYSRNSAQLISYPDHLEVLSSGSVLRLAARKLGDCHHLIICSNDIEEVLVQIIDLLVLLSDIAVSDTFAQAKIRPAARLNLLDRLSRALFDTPTYHKWIKSGETVLEKLYRLQEMLRTTGDAADPSTVHRLKMDHSLSSFEDMVLSLAGKTVFTAMGCIGVTVGDLAENDEIVIGRGFTHPAVLRKAGGKGAQVQEFKLVGSRTLMESWPTNSRIQT
jgi:hypothetical protein